MTDVRYEVPAIFINELVGRLTGMGYDAEHQVGPRGPAGEPVMLVRNVADADVLQAVVDEHRPGTHRLKA